MVNLSLDTEAKAPYKSPAWFQPASEGQPFSGQPAINMYITAGANLGQPFLPVTLLETRVDPHRRVRIPLRFMEFLHVEVGPAGHQPWLKSSCKAGLTSRIDPTSKDVCQIFGSQF